MTTPASTLKPQTSNDAKPFAGISLDLDNKWCYMKTHGDHGWEQFPSYLDIFVPHVLEVLDHLDLKITFFIVGQDAALDQNRDILKLLTENGQEVGNHSFSHEPWFHLYSKDRIEREVVEAEEQIFRVSGEKPIGFRGPGFSWSPTLLEVLIEHGYVYDASTLPTFLGPLARAYFLRKSNLNNEERAHRHKLFGTLKDGMRPIKPYWWSLPSGEKLLEIPVTTIPIFRTPFHLSYLIYLSRFSVTLMLFYLHLALVMCRVTETRPNFLLHPLDLLDADQVPELSFFPGMELNGNRKIDVFKKVLQAIQKEFSLVTMKTQAQKMSGGNNIRNICCKSTNST